MKTKIIMFLALLTLLVSCGSDSDAPPSSGAGVSGSNEQEAKKDPEVVPSEVANCSVVFTRKDKFEMIAVKSHRARVECKLTEDEIVKMVEKSRS